jgi:drug/metabolite transporter (DMT)-like permease
MPVAPGAKNWALLAALVAMWGSAFMFVKIGVASVPPSTLVAARLAVGAAVLYAMVRMRGLRLGPLGPGSLAIALLAVVGNCVPFFLITWGQQFVDSALAAILMAAMPLATMVLAHFLVAGERMTPGRGGGFLIGFAGIVFLMGPAALAGVGGSLREVVAQATILGGALCYAANSVLARRVVTDDFLITSTAVIIVATVVMVPVALVVDRPWTLSPSWASAAAILWLGAGPTAIATIVYFRLIAAAGPTFMSIVNYLSPLVALVAGVLLLGEEPGPSAITGLALIMLGIAVSRRG